MVSEEESGAARLTGAAHASTLPSAPDADPCLGRHAKRTGVQLSVRVARREAPPRTATLRLTARRAAALPLSLAP
jgi:hypothetical protein